MQARTYRPELSDLLIRYDSDGKRVPVPSDEVIRALRRDGYNRSARLAASFPQRNGFFVADAVDKAVVNSHLELQRLAEEIHHGPSVARLIKPLVDVLDRPVTIVDIGCGSGYLVRYFASTKTLGANVRVIGVDFNQLLLQTAQRLANMEGLDCTFLASDAFALATPADIYISSGVLHHFRKESLAGFFAQQHAAGAVGCFHFDIAPTSLTAIGAWVFHRARMRERLARHDGVHSALRAYEDSTLVEAVRKGSPGWTPLLFDGTGTRSALVNVMRPIIGLAPDLVTEYGRAMGKLRPRLTQP